MSWNTPHVINDIYHEGQYKVHVLQKTWWYQAYCCMYVLESLQINSMAESFRRS